MAGILVEGTILDRLDAGLYKAELPNGHQIIAHFPQKVMVEAIPILPGNKVLVEISPYDLSRGRITRSPEHPNLGHSPAGDSGRKSTSVLSFEATSPGVEEGNGECGSGTNAMEAAKELMEKSN